jgi:hypothetical protein
MQSWLREVVVSLPTSDCFVERVESSQKNAIIESYNVDLIMTTGPGAKRHQVSYARDPRWSNEKCPCHEERTKILQNFAVSIKSPLKRCAYFHIKRHLVSVGFRGIYKIDISLAQLIVRRSRLYSLSSVLSSCALRHGEVPSLRRKHLTRV